MRRLHHRYQRPGRRRLGKNVLLRDAALVMGLAPILLCGWVPSARAEGSSYAHNAQQGYVGAQRCASCHQFAYQVWLASPHAKAHQSLTAAQLSDSRCNNCHNLLPDTENRFVGVQCETCHGPGKYYQAEYVMKDHDLARAVGLIDTKPTHCQQCHTPGAPSITPFDFETMWARIDHSKAAEQLAKTQSGGG